MFTGPCRPSRHLFRVLPALLALGLGTAGAADLVIYDDAAATQWRKLERVTEQVTAAHRGPFGLLVQPTQWHKPLLVLKAGRTDFRPYDRLELDIRSPNGPIDPTLTLWDYALGTTRSLAPYTEGGVIDATWRHVSIPLADLASPAFALDSVFTFMFGTMAVPKPFHIDNLVLTRTKGPTVTGQAIRSSRALTLMSDGFDHVASDQPAGYRITSTTDPAYATPVQPLAVGSDRQAIGVGAGGLEAVVESRLHLLLPNPLQPGQDYRVTLAGMVWDGDIPAEQEAVTVTWDARQPSESIQVNQVGYAPGAPKLAYVGNWLGDLGPLPVDDRAFQVVDTTTGAVAYAGSLTLRTTADPQSGADVYEADFSDLTTPGQYRIEVPQIGRSFPFSIAEDVYDEVYRTLMRSFYHRRNITLTAPFADPGYERLGIDPALDGIYHPALADYPLSAGESPFAIRPIAPGWFDAGDYGQYLHNAAPVWGTIGLAFDLAEPGHFADGELNIPESGNGIPDILDELGFGMDWALSMQDTSDGGVYWRLTSGDWDRGLPAAVTQPRFIYEKTTRATAQFAAMGALYARLIAPYDAARAATVLSAARSAWNYVQTHPAWPAEGTRYTNPDQYPGGGEYAVASSKPALLWAAAELYRTTGETNFQDAYRGLIAKIAIDVTAGSRETFPHWALVMAKYANRDPILAEEARRAILTGADTQRAWAAQNPYRAAKHPNPQYTGWSNFSASVMAALPLLQAHHLTGLPIYRDGAWIAANVILGANPLSRSFITGIGARPPLDPLDLVSLNDAQDPPVRGLVVPGVTWHLPGFREPYISVNAAYYPAETPASPGDFAHAYPVLRRYTDAHDLIPMSEGTVQEAAYVAVAFGLLRDGSAPVPLADPAYAWDPEHPKGGKVYNLTDLPPAEVPYLTPAQITAFGEAVGVAGNAWLAQLTPAQVAAIAAPNTPYWVARLSASQQEALTGEQIAAFVQWSLMTALPATEVALIPPAKVAGLGLTIAQTSHAWKAALTAAQRAALTPQQLEILAKASY
jgi:endoglucanase